MITRRSFTRRVSLAASLPLWTEAALAQRALVGGDVPPDTVWLNANENPEGPGKAALEAMGQVLPSSFRYHFQEFGAFYRAIAASENLRPDEIWVGAGSTEPIVVAVQVFASPTRPVITADPSFELPVSAAQALGFPVVRVPLTGQYSVDVRRMAVEADKAGGGLLYVCNPNNPTSSLTPKEDMAWLASNLPRNTVLLVDEAYIHFAGPRAASLIPFLRRSSNVLVTRTFSKIYGMAGLRVGFCCGPGELISRMTPFRGNVVSIVSARAVQAALKDPALVPERRARLTALRAGLCSWLAGHKVRFIEPHANFIMIDVGRDVRRVIAAMLSRGVAPGRPFPPLDNMLRVTLGTPAEMEKFKTVFLEVMKT